MTGRLFAIVVDEYVDVAVTVLVVEEIVVEVEAVVIVLIVLGDVGLVVVAMTDKDDVEVEIETTVEVVVTDVVTSLAVDVDVGMDVELSETSSDTVALVIPADVVSRVSVVSVANGSDQHASDEPERAAYTFSESRQAESPRRTETRGKQ